MKTIISNVLGNYAVSCTPLYPLDDADYLDLTVAPFLTQPMDENTEILSLGLITDYNVLRDTDICANEMSELVTSTMDRVLDYARRLAMVIADN